MKKHLSSLRYILSLLTVCLLVVTTACAETNKPPVSYSVQQVMSRIPTRYYYQVDFPGGTAGGFFEFWRTNGFANDSVLFAGNARQVVFPAFKISDAQLPEIAKSIEFVTEGRLSIDVVEKSASDRGNIWRVKLADTQPGQLKTRACALPTIFAAPEPRERIQGIADKVGQALIQGAIDVNRSEANIPQGRLSILASEKIVVAVGTEAYVEAITSALEAAEKVAASEAAAKQTE